MEYAQLARRAFIDVCTVYKNSATTKRGEVQWSPTVQSGPAAVQQPPGRADKEKEGHKRKQNQRRLARLAGSGTMV